MYSSTEQLLLWLVNLGYNANTYPQRSQDVPFVTVERTGGNVADMVDHPIFAIQTWAQSQAEAEELALEIRNETFVTLPHGFSQMQVNSGPYPFWDEDTGLPRYQTVYECTTILIED